jgi:hypothetical protein
MEVHKTKALAAAALVAAGGESKVAVDAYKEYYEAAFPFAAKHRGQSDHKMMERMKKEVEAGPIYFKTVQVNNPLREKARQLQLPDDFRQKLAERARKKK